MTKEELFKNLEMCFFSDPFSENDYVALLCLLLDYINDKEIEDFISDLEKH